MDVGSHFVFKNGYNDFGECYWRKSHNFHQNKALTLRIQTS